MKILVLTCDRLDSLKKAIESALEVFPITQIYIYIDKFYDLESNKKQKELIKYVNSIEGAKVKVSKENNGCSYSMLKALEWIGETESEWLVIEDDVQVTLETFEYFSSLEIDRSKPFVIRFGDFFWGWYVNKLAIDEIIRFDLQNISDEDYILNHSKNRYFRHLNHFRLEKEMIKRKIGTAWDQVFIISILFLEITIFVPKKPLSKRIECDSTRLRRNTVQGKEFKTGRIVMINGVIQ
jgi:hypothetical protein